MTKEEKRTKIRTILSHIDGVKMDLGHDVSKLEELGKTQAAAALLKLIFKIEAWEHRADLNK